MDEIRRRTHETCEDAGLTEKSAQNSRSNSAECPLLAQSGPRLRGGRMTAFDPKRTLTLSRSPKPTPVVGRRSNYFGCSHGADYPGCEHRFPSPLKQFAVSNGPQSFKGNDCGPFVLLDPKQSPTLISLTSRRSRPLKKFFGRFLLWYSQQSILLSLFQSASELLSERVERLCARGTPLLCHP
jgi:hypothetical protein